MYLNGIFKPTSSAFTTSSTGTALGTKTHTNDGNAYDPSIATSADLNVLMDAPIASGTQSQIATYAGFGTGKMVGTLQIIITSTTVETFGIGAAHSNSSGILEFSTNSGGVWTNISTVQGSSISQWSSSNPIIKPVSGVVDLAQLQIRITATGQSSFVSGTDKCKADADILVYDISFY